MNDDAQDIYREMDALADYLFTRMARDFGGGMPQGFSYHMIIQNSVDQSSLRGEPEMLSPRPGSEPLPEVHRIDDEVMVIAELPGATRETVRMTLTGNELVIDADGGVRQYHTSAALPPVDPDSMQTSITNSVLEVKFKTLPVA